MSKLGRLQPVKLRDIWQDEAEDFTPWLAEEENLALLSKTLDLKLELEGQEINMENSVLTSCARMRMVHGSSLKTSWKLPTTGISVKFSHTQLDWVWILLSGSPKNSRMSIELHWSDSTKITTEAFQYFGIEVKVWQIGDSPAPHNLKSSAVRMTGVATVSQNTQRAVSSNPLTHNYSRKILDRLARPHESERQST